MQLQQIDVTGARLVGALYKDLGHDGPKHHAVVLGKNAFNGVVYLAELMTHGYQIATYQDFHQRYSANGPICVEPNEGPHNNVQVAQRAIEEINRGQTRYDLLVNNCECFVNRAMHGKSTSTQVINTAIGILLVIGLVYVVKNSG